MLDKIMAFLDTIGPILYIVVPAAFGVYFNLKDKVRQKEKEVKETNKAKAKQAYKIWEHEESQHIIRKIKDLCNIYKDKSNAGLTQYIQLENGTMATSKICNMFVSCLAEDDRYGKVHKLSSQIQRIPYSKMTGWINQIVANKNSEFNYVLTPDISKADYSLTEIVDAPEVESCIVAPVYDPHSILLGMCVFYYSEVEYAGHETSEIQLINKFRTGVEGILWQYHLDRREKKISLGLDGDLDE